VAAAKADERMLCDDTTEGAPDLVVAPGYGPLGTGGGRYIVTEA
jgi:hypothetical protein